VRRQCPHGHGYVEVREEPHVEAIHEPIGERLVIVTDLACGHELVIEKPRTRE